MIEAATRETFLSALLSGDVRSCESLVDRLLTRGTPALTLYTHLIRPALHKIGTLWETNRISVADEHLASAVTERLLARIAPAQSRAAPAKGRRAVVSCAPLEHHQFGARMVADLLESRGFDVSFLGANTPEADLLAHVRARRPDFVALSVSVFMNLAPLGHVLDKINRDLPELPFAVGGQAFLHGGTDLLRRHPGARYFESLERFAADLDAGRFPPCAAGEAGSTPMKRTEGRP